MSVKDFIAHNSAGYALVRTPDDPAQREKLSKALTGAGAHIQPEKDGALRVSGLELPRISDLAHDADVRLWELSPHQASLEEAYMRMTNAAVDYRSADDARQGLQQPAPAAPGWGQPYAPQAPAQGPGWGQPQYGPPQPAPGMPNPYAQPPYAQPPYAQPAAPAPAAQPPAAPAPAALPPAAPAPVSATVTTPIKTEDAR
jgi:ABC-2 type transport system ATP-binding protein